MSELWNVFKDTDNEEKIDYHNDGFVRWSGVFGQLEYSNDDLSVFVQGAVSNQGFQREEFFNKHLEIRKLIGKTLAEEI